MKINQAKLGTSVIAALFGACGMIGQARAQVPQEPIGARVETQVALPGGGWGTSVSINPGDRVEWRVVISHTGIQSAAALGRIYYQPVLSNVDNTGGGNDQDQVGVFRQPPNAILSDAEGTTTFPLPSYGRVVYAMNQSLTFVAHRHSNSSDGAPLGDYLRIAQTSATQWYPLSGPGNLSAGVVSDNGAASSTIFNPGTQNLTIFRQAFIASTDAPGQPRTVSLFIDAASLMRAGGSSGSDDTRYMTWAAAGEGGSTASIRVGVEFIPATITIVPAPGAASGLIALGTTTLIRRRRGGAR